MVTYQLFSKQINDQVRVEIIYENYPVIGGTEELSILIRFLYVGDIPEKRHIDGPPLVTSPDGDALGAEPASEQSENTSGWGRRISSQLSQATRALFLQELETVNENDEDEDEVELTKNDVTLFLGYSQVLGYYTVNDDIIDFSIFEDLQKSTVIGGKYAGIDGLDVPSRDAKSNSIATGLADLYGKEINKLGNGVKEHYKMIPFYSTNQEVLFSEISFEPSTWDDNMNSDKTVKSFYINLKLPKDLPPTFDSEAGKIGYTFILGYQDKNFTHETIMVPLKIQPYVDQFGRQPLFHLERARLNVHPEKDLAIDINSNGNGSLGRRTSVSFRQMRHDIQETDPKKLAHKSSVVSFDTIHRRTADQKDNAVGVDSWSQTFLELTRDLDSSSRNDVMKVQGRFDKEMTAKEERQFNARENLIHIMADYKNVQKIEYDPELDDEEGIDYISLIPRSENTKYLLRQNHMTIAMLALDRGVSKIGDMLNLSLSFENCQLETKGLEVQLVRCQNFYRDEYLRQNEYGEPYKGLTKENSLETVVFEKLLSTFEVDTVSTDIQIPLETEPQFRTNYYEVRYYVQVRFILLDQHGEWENLKQKKKQQQKKKQETENGEATPLVDNSEHPDQPETPNHQEQREIDPVDPNHQVNNDSVMPEQTVPTAQTVSAPLPLRVFDLTDIFVDTSGSVLFKGQDHFEDAYDFTVRVPVVILPNYEQQFGCVTNF